MNNKDVQVLKKIQAHIVSVLKYCENCKTLDEFQMDSMRVEACVFNLMQIGGHHNTMETALWYAEQNCSWILWCRYEYCLVYHIRRFACIKT